MRKTWRTTRRTRRPWQAVENESNVDKWFVDIWLWRWKGDVWRDDLNPRQRCPRLRVLLVGTEAWAHSERRCSGRGRRGAEHEQRGEKATQMVQVFNQPKGLHDGECEASSATTGSAKPSTTGSSHFPVNRNSSFVFESRFRNLRPGTTARAGQDAALICEVMDFHVRTGGTDAILHRKKLAVMKLEQLDRDTRKLVCFVNFLSSCCTCVCVFHTLHSGACLRLLWCCPVCST